MKRLLLVGLICMTVLMVFAGCERNERSSTLVIDAKKNKETYTTVMVTTVEPTTEVVTEPDLTLEETSQSTAFSYVLNTNTHRFHYPDCESVKKIKDKNKQAFCGTREEVIEAGYQPCGQCHP